MTGEMWAGQLQAQALACIQKLNTGLEPHLQAARLANFGATCYLNATLQALVHTAPLAQELLANEAVVGNGREAMVLRLMQQHVRECLGGSAPYVKPGRLLQVLHKLNPRHVFSLIAVVLLLGGPMPLKYTSKHHQAEHE